MTTVVGVHGIGNYAHFQERGSAAEAAWALGREWRDWLGRADDLDVSVGYYAHLLHRGTAQGATDPRTLEPDAQRALIAWITQLQPTPAVAQGPLTARVRQAADWVTRNHGAVAAAACVVFCREVHTYLADPDSPRRAAARAEVATAIRERRPDVVVAHSLGSVVAYEALWESGLEVPLLVTVGSPLAMPTVIFDRLHPAPVAARGKRPPGVRRWVNLADVGDLVALPRSGIGGRFEGVDGEHELVIGAVDFHRAKSYLATPEVRALIRSGA